MNWFERMLWGISEWKMTTPEPFGVFHLTSLAIAVLLLIVLLTVGKNSDKKLKIILLTYAIIATIFETTKQLMWAMHYDELTNTVSWAYSWYSAPYQLCTTPIFASFIAALLPNNGVRKGLLSYMAFTTILGSLSFVFMPASCFVSQVEINVHTAFLHLGSFVLSMYLLISGIVEIKLENVFKGLIAFACFVIIALALDIIVYKSGMLDIDGGDVFNMFYISPYFPCTLPVLSDIYASTPYAVFLLLYFVAIGLGNAIIFGISALCKLIVKRIRLAKTYA